MSFWEASGALNHYWGLLSWVIIKMLWSTSHPRPLFWRAIFTGILAILWHLLTHTCPHNEHLWHLILKHLDLHLLHLKHALELTPELHRHFNVIVFKFTLGYQFRKWELIILPQRLPSTFSRFCQIYGFLRFQDFFLWSRNKFLDRFFLDVLFDWIWVILALNNLDISIFGHMVPLILYTETPYIQVLFTKNGYFLCLSIGTFFKHHFWIFY